MRVINIAQNSEEWIEFRQNKISGSKLQNLYSKTNPLKSDITDFLDSKGIEYNKQAILSDLIDMIGTTGLAKIKARNKKDEFYKLVADSIARPFTPNDYGNPKITWMERGHILEPEALQAFNDKTGLNATPGRIWVHDNNENIMVSPDGEIEIDGEIKEAVEIKCPDSHKIIRAYHEKTWPQEYREQVTQYFLVNEKLEKLHFVLYTDLIPSLPIQVFEIKRGDVEQDIQLYFEFENIILKEAQALAEELAF